MLAAGGRVGPAMNAGIGLKPEHFDAALAAREPGLWFEVHAENHMVDGGPRLAWLEAIRERHPLSLHGVSLSLGGSEPLDRDALARLATLVRRLDPALVSEHLAWSRAGGAWLPDLLPVVRTKASLDRIVARVQRLQEAIGRPVSIENPSHYLEVDAHEIGEIDFLGELARRSGCGLLLDLANVHVSANNLGFAAEAYVDDFPAEAVTEIHVAGSHADPVLGAALLIDAHDSPVPDPVWALHERFVARAGPRPVLVERDADVPPFEALLAEARRANASVERAAPARAARVARVARVAPMVA